MSIRILHTADIHLGAPMTAFGEQAAHRKVLLRETFLDVCDLAVERGVHLFFCAGDLFDSVRPESDDVECARTGFARLQAAKIPAFAVPGGHDGGGTFHNTLEILDISGLTVLGGSIHSSPRILSIHDSQINLYGLSARAGATPDLESMRRRDLPGFHVALLHATVIQGDQFNVPSRDIPVTREQLAGLKLDYIALGHYHNFQIVEHRDLTLGCYPGTIEAKRFVETGPRHIALVTLTEAGLNIAQVEVGQTTVESFELPTDDMIDDEAMVKRLRNLGGDRKFARVTLTGLRDSLLDVDRIRSEAAPAFRLLELIDRTAVAGDAPIRAVAGEPTVRGMATAHLLKKLDAAQEQEERRTLHAAINVMLHEFARHRKGRLE